MFYTALYYCPHFRHFIFVRTASTYNSEYHSLPRTINELPTTSDGMEDWKIKVCWRLIVPLGWGHWRKDVTLRETCKVMEHMNITRASRPEVIHTIDSSEWIIASFFFFLPYLIWWVLNPTDGVNITTRMYQFNNKKLHTCRVNDERRCKGKISAGQAWNHGIVPEPWSSRSWACIFHNQIFFCLCSSKAKALLPHQKNIKHATIRHLRRQTLWRQSAYHQGTTAFSVHYVPFLICYRATSRIYISF